MSAEMKEFLVRHRKKFMGRMASWLIVFVLLSLAVSFVPYAINGDSLLDWFIKSLESTGINLATELLGVFATLFVINKWLERFDENQAQLLRWVKVVEDFEEKYGDLGRDEARKILYDALSQRDK